MTRKEHGKRTGTTKGHRAKIGDQHKRLSKRERQFVIEYTTHWNATQAVLNAGLCRPGTSRAVAGVHGCNLLKKDKIKQAVTNIVDEVIKDKEALRARVIEEYRALAFSDIKEIVEYRGNGSPLAVRDLEEIDSRAIQSIERVPVATNSQGVIDHVVRVKLHEKKGALDSLSKYLGMFSDQPSNTEIHIHIDERDAKLV